MSDQAGKNAGDILFGIRNDFPEKLVGKHRNQLSESKVERRCVIVWPVGRTFLHLQDASWDVRGIEK